MPPALRSGVRGGTELWERARVAWEVGESLPEFEDRPEEQQSWLLATWRTMQKISAVEAIERWRKAKR
jgi:hypothetical protein